MTQIIQTIFFFTCDTPLLVQFQTQIYFYFCMIFIYLFLTHKNKKNNEMIKIEVHMKVTK